VSLPEPFRWDGDHIAISLPGAEVRFTTRRGGVSQAPYDTLNLGLWTDDDPASVSANRERLAHLVGIPRERFQQGRQVHGAEVVALDGPPQRAARERAASPEALPAEEPPEADGQVTGAEGVAAVVLVADCLPIALARPGKVGMLHAGWRGLAAGIVGAGVAAFGDEPPAAAAIGPGAGPCCYAAGEEVHAAFADLGPSVRHGDNADLPAIAAARLREAGVATIHDIGVCTLCADRGLFFSHRRDGGVTGRQAGVAWRS
jgi:purine-nucleoside/S-methyl-5'-thioadenosine phosphorylase / adenosine deaminase